MYQDIYSQKGEYLRLVVAFTSVVYLRVYICVCVYIYIYIYIYTLTLYLEVAGTV